MEGKGGILMLILMLIIAIAMIAGTSWAVLKPEAPKIVKSTILPRLYTEGIDIIEIEKANLGVMEIIEIKKEEFLKLSEEEDVKSVCIFSEGAKIYYYLPSKGLVFSTSEYFPGVM